LIHAGLAHRVTGLTINQVCGSGLRAVGLAYAQMQAGMGSVMIAGGQESMSRAIHGGMIRMGQKMGDCALVDTMQEDGLTDAFHRYAMGITAENIATQWNISRAEQDAFALASQQKAAKALADGVFVDEIVPIDVVEKKMTRSFSTDEFIRTETSLEGLQKLRPVFKPDGTVTAGNASGINDGAAAVVLMTRSEAERRGLRPLAVIRGFGQSGVDPAVMGIGPVGAVRAALQWAGWSVQDLDAIESNEAFAVQSLAVQRELGFPMDRVNRHGGAIAIGHPIGASGARLLVTLLHSMQRDGYRRGLATLCIGGGMGVALCVEREG
jgi:acetyl-CoA C-acetyltransferase